MRLMRSIVFVVFWGVLSTAQGKTLRFDMRDGAQRNVVHFVSEALLETVVGVSSAVWGSVDLDPTDLRKGIAAEFEMDIRTFETGIASRNQALAEKVFLAYHHPVAKYTVLKVLKRKQSRLYPAKKTAIEVEGELSFRGMVRKENAKVFLTYLPESDSTQTRVQGNLLKVQTVLDLNLSDFQIVIPPLWKDRFASRVRVEFNAIGTDKSPARTVVLPPQVAP